MRAVAMMNSSVRPGRVYRPAEGSDDVFVLGERSREELGARVDAERLAALVAQLHDPRSALRRAHAQAQHRWLVVACQLRQLLERLAHAGHAKLELGIVDLVGAAAAAAQRGRTVGVFERPGYYCKKVSEEAARFLVAEKPDLAFVHFSDPDEAGHSTGWLSESYKRAGAASDRCLGTLYQALERSGLLEETLLIVSADHGGHNHGHSGALSCDREIPWIARGPRVRRDYNIHSPISTMDTAATALRALNLPLPAKLAGKPITEIFL